jgi:integrase
MARRPGVQVACHIKSHPLSNQGRPQSGGAARSPDRQSRDMADRACRLARRLCARNALLSDRDVHALIDAAWETDSAFGLLVETAAVTGARVSQLRRIEVADLRADAVLMTPGSRKGRRKRVERRPVPICESLASKLRSAAGGRPATEALLLRSNGTPWRHNDHSKLFIKAAAKAGIKATIYSLRHSAIVRSLLRGVPIRIVANNADTSVVMIERTYSRYIGDRSDQIARAALLDPAVRP